MNGTSSSTPYSAAMAAVLLSERPGLKWKPEVVKAVFLAAGSIMPTNNEDHDPDALYTAHIPMYDKMVGSRNTVRSWEGENYEIFDRDRYLTFKETGIVKGARYRIAISWLSSGGDIDEDFPDIHQDIDLQVYQNGKLIASSSSGANTFEVVDFRPTTAGDLTIKLYRYSNMGIDRVILGYSMVRVS